jgi:DNA-binding MarR family transcriptional regulator
MINRLIKSLLDVKSEFSSYRIGLLQTKAYRILNQRTAEYLKEFNISPIQWALLGLLYENPNGLKFSEAAEALWVEAPFITEMIEPLETQKLIKIGRLENDQRVKILSLSEQGKSEVPIIESRLRKKIKPLLLGLSPREFLIYRKVMQQIIKNQTDSE